MNTYHPVRLNSVYAFDLKLGDTFIYHKQNAFEVVDFVVDSACAYMGCKSQRLIGKGVNNTLTIKLNCCKVHYTPTRVFLLNNAEIGRFNPDGLESSFMIGDNGKVIEFPQILKLKKVV